MRLLPEIEARVEETRRLQQKIAEIEDRYEAWRRRWPWRRLPRWARPYVFKALGG